MLHTDISNLHVGDCRTILAEMPENSFQTVVTSPPYWRLKDYGTDPIIWETGQECATHNFDSETGLCACGAWRGSLGLEPNQSDYIDHILDVMDHVRRVLKEDGVLWLNLGDTFAQSKGSYGIKRKEICGIPWRVALALSEMGWFLRQCVIWWKPNVPPESVTDRPTRDHEYLFMLTKTPKYFYDWKAIAEPQKTESVRRQLRPWNGNELRGSITGPNRMSEYHAKHMREGPCFTRRKRSVWKMSVVPVKGNHFATFPPQLVETCLKATSLEGDIVLDPFMGSGTVAVVAERLNRGWVGVDVSEEYCGLAISRIIGARDAESTE
jgi:DNA modification methylase